ncbi:unnamed protein product [Closterium sp. NIES-65]|nr:unnamed protein product [Closterium sp. NIES-65]
MSCYDVMVYGVERRCNVMTNTQAPAEVVDCSNPRYSKYYVIVIQYSARLNAEKVRNFVYALNNGTVPKKRINSECSSHAT